MENGHSIEVNAHIFYELVAAGDELAKRLERWIEWHGRATADRAAVERWKAAGHEVESRRI